MLWHIHSQFLLYYRNTIGTLCIIFALHVIIFNYILGRAQYLIKSVISILTVWEIAYCQFFCDVIIHLISLWFYIHFPKNRFHFLSHILFFFFFFFLFFFSCATIKSKVGKECLKERMMHQGSLKKTFWCYIFFFPRGCAQLEYGVLYSLIIQRVCQQWSTVNESINKILSVWIFLYCKPQRDLSAKGKIREKAITRIKADPTTSVCPY